MKVWMFQIKQHIKPVITMLFFLFLVIIIGVFMGKRNIYF